MDLSRYRQTRRARCILRFVENDIRSLHFGRACSPRRVGHAWGQAVQEEKTFIQDWSEHVAGLLEHAIDGKRHSESSVSFDLTHATHLTDTSTKRT